MAQTSDIERADTHGSAGGPRGSVERPHGPAGSTAGADTALAPAINTIVGEVDLAVTGMTCASCVARVEKKLNKLPGVDAVVNLATEQAHLELGPQAAELSDAELVTTVENAGYGASVLRRTMLQDDGSRIAVSTGIDPEEVEAAAQRAANARVADLWRRFVVALILSIPIVAVSMVPALQFRGWQWATGALSLIVAFWCGWPFHRAAFRAARHGSTTMDTLVSLGVLASMGWSLWALLWGGAGALGYTMRMTGIHGLAHSAMPHLYFESAAMIVTFLLIGRWLEARSRRSAGDALRSLLSLGADEATRVRRADGTAVNEVIPASELQPGDEFLVRPGEKIATDGVVIDGTSAVDASLLTGESVPVDVTSGNEVTGATMNTFGSLTVRASRVGENTTLAQMGRLLTEAQIGKAPVQRLADRISAVFVPAVIGIAFADLTVRLLFGNTFEMALTSAITVLVVACPCALGLATPTALLVGSGRASRLGALIKGPEILETAHSVDTILLDKTGTLTTGVMRVDDVVAVGEVADIHEEASIHEEAGVSAPEGSAPQDAQSIILALAASLESKSEHPIAAAITRSASEKKLELLPVHDFHAHAGHGVSGIVNGELLRVGTARWLAEQGVDTAAAATAAQRLAASGATAVVVARDQRVIGVLAVRDTLRPEAPETIARLKEQHLQPMLVTGDNEATAQTIAARAGIQQVQAGVLPNGKLTVVSALQAQGHRVAMVGDGVNDAAALAGADLSIAMGSGTDVAKAASDITIVNSDIRTIPAALRVSSRTLRIIKENLCWAFGYNVIAIPLAVLGIIVPGIAAAAMASSSVIVVLNSLRLRRA
ncbi:heavy metal translocating P-type ATPase [Actinobaculum sp. 352]|uniref:heavy metal translocating P-type ATPase n=1 Tax=Actinobaculum sp. 352 TaxID=2490946 RepID=UPI000F7EB29A|nr:heavy metal translocating P-type ATPase [Actinobaculum sp. 352]RTE49879.1 copper-translocating P-type ATPase [Actinobaculum sp. 352]